MFLRYCELERVAKCWNIAGPFSKIIFGLTLNTNGLSNWFLFSLCFYLKMLGSLLFRNSKASVYSNTALKAKSVARQHLKSKAEERGYITNSGNKKYLEFYTSLKLSFPYLSKIYFFFSFLNLLQ